MMIEQPTLDFTKGYADAVISDCGRYRYELIRRWGDGPLLEWIMLNPSKATAELDDATIRRCVGFARLWGYGGIRVTNLFGFRATDPSALDVGALDVTADPVGPGNAAYLNHVIGPVTIAAWGANRLAVAEAAKLKRRNLWSLGTNQNGSPKHPLYVPSWRTPTKWKAPE